MKDIEAAASHLSKRRAVDGSHDFRRHQAGPVARQQAGGGSPVVSLDTLLLKLHQRRKCRRVTSLQHVVLANAEGP